MTNNMGEKEDLVLFVNGEQLMIGTFIKVVDVVKAAINIYIGYSKYGGMCKCFRLALISMGINKNQEADSYISKNIPLFSYEIAVEKFNANGKKNNLWWGNKEVENRLDYFEWLLTQYGNQV